MSIVVLAKDKKASSIQEQLSRLTDIPVLLPEEIEDNSAVKYAIVWKHPQRDLFKYERLSMICSFGAGVDHLFQEGTGSIGVPIVRIGDAGLAEDMGRYMIAALGYWEQRLQTYAQQQAEKIWRPQRARPKPFVGILGLGVIGQHVATVLSHLGYQVKGYSLSPKKLEGVATYAGASEWDAFLADLDCLICLLPLTDASRGVVDLAVLQKLNKGAFLINAARGGVLNEEDLLHTLNSGQLSAAFLDVFEEEPLSKEHPFWTHPQITITPHVAALTNVPLACQQIAENIERHRKGLPLQYEIGRAHV